MKYSKYSYYSIGGNETTAKCESCNNYGYCKVFKHNADTNSYTLTLDSFRLEMAVERAFANAVKEQTIKPKEEKADEGRGGK